MLPFLGLVAALAFSSTLVLSLAGALNPAALAHLVFAIAVVPLILGVMTHFIPVLTRSRAPSRWVLWLPVPAILAGLVVVLALAGYLPRSSLHGAVLIDGAAAVALFVWAIRRTHSTLGRAHPCINWYLAALAMFCLALLVVPVFLVFPEWWQDLRLWHIHLNTLGFVAMAALGTLPVLLPTALKQTDSGALRRLQTDWLFLIGAVLALVLGLMFWRPMMLAAVIYCIVVARNLYAWRMAYGWRKILDDGVAASLFLATFFLLVLTAAGIAHAFRPAQVAARPAIMAFVVGFLFPLVSGALSQLLPVWVFPGKETEARVRWREDLARHGLWRSLLFVGAGCALLLVEDAILAAWLPLLAVAVGAGLVSFLSGLCCLIGRRA